MVMIPEGEIQSLNKSRQRMVYYRRDGTPTLLLPSDAISQSYYLSKGFTATPSRKTVVLESGGSNLECSTCGFVAKSAFGLQTHTRKHKKEDN